MLRPPSLQHEYDEHYSRDPAFEPPDLTPPLDAGPEEEAEHAQAIADHAERVRVARERGDWSGLVKDGSPTKFTFRQVPGTVFSLVQDDIADDTVGPFEFPVLMFRLAIVKVANLGPDAPKVKQLRHPRYGAIADEAVVNYILGVDEGRAVIAELGRIVIQRSMGPSPK